jgi:hypothetical protein
MRLLEGGCQLPLGVHVTHDEEAYRLRAALAPPPAPGELPAPASEPVDLRGTDLDDLVSQAYDRLRPTARRDRAATEGDS